MTHILVAGAGKSSTYLIDHLLQCALRRKWIVTVADGSMAAIDQKLNGHPCGRAAAIDITSDQERQALVKAADIVVSLMPPALHTLLAKDCLQYGKHLITASYVSAEMQELDKAVKEKGLMFLCEMGLDPGIDHMTASQIMHGIQKVSATLTCFKSYCGGLIAPESDDNPWHYKFSWNPRNIILAGIDGADFLYKKKKVHIGYDELFDGRKKIKVDGLGSLAYYPNRDSLHYIDLYETYEAETFLRATLRHPDFVTGWRAIVDLHLNDVKDEVPATIKTYADWIQWKCGIATNSAQSLKAAVAQLLKEEEQGKIMDMLDWLGIFSQEPIPAAKTSGDILLDVLLRKWELKPTDKDMVVMKHEVEYEQKGQTHCLSSTMILTGENATHSAMAKTVGLPMAIMTELILDKKITQLPTGICIPTMPAIYRPVLRKLEHAGIRFVEQLK